jgi:predicted transcriptional regulator
MSMEINNNYPMTLAVAAKDLKVSVKTLYWHINVKEDLRVDKLGNLYIIKPEEWARFKSEYLREKSR